MTQRLSADEARVLYLREKEKRAGRPKPELAEAKAAFARIIEREKAARKGGRPKARLKSMSVDRRKAK